MKRKQAGQTLLALTALALMAGSPLASAQQPKTLSAAALGQIAALQAEKDARTPAQQKLDSQLIWAMKKSRGEKFAAGLESFAEGVKVAADGLELVDIKADVSDALLKAIKAEGGTIVSSVPGFRAIRARVPLKSLETLAARPDVQFIRPAVMAITNAGPTTSQGDKTHRADVVRTTLKAQGFGLKIGVLSDSVDFLSSSQGSGELGPVTVLPGQSGLNAGADGEGTAMLEIVHDLAPKSDLFFATAFTSEAQFAQNIIDLRKAGCDIIVDDVFYFDESPFQDGPVAQAVTQVVNDGALYFSAAGNEGNQNDGTSGTWEGDFKDGGPTSSPIGAGGRLHDFGNQTFNTQTAGAFGNSLFWADPAGASRNDYDLYILNAAGTAVVAASTNTQNGTQDPFEFIDGNLINTRSVIVKSVSAKPRYLNLGCVRGEYQISTPGVNKGHSSAAKAIAVAAVDAATSFPNPFVGGAQNPVEDYSSDGPRRVFFSPDGVPLTPGDFSSTGGFLLSKPDLAAADGVATSVPGFQPFFGTSAAAPHAAAIAALIWSRNRGLSPEEVVAAMKSTALDIEGPGPDRDSGAGLVDAFLAAQAVPAGPIIEPGVTTITAQSYTPATGTSDPASGALDPGETLTISVPLQNVGPVASTALMARLLATGGVNSPSAPADYGAVAPNATTSRTFTFQGNGSPGGKVIATFELTDGSDFLGSFSVTFKIGISGSPTVFSGGSAISIPSSGNGTPYPSTLTVAGAGTSAGKVTVTLSNFSHTYPEDVEFLLVSPAGKKVLIMSRIGGSVDAVNLNLTFDDDAAGLPPATLVSGTYQPAPNGGTGTSLPAPAPTQPYAGALAAFTGDNPNGTWSLYATDRVPSDSGSLGSWSLTLTPVTVATTGANADLSPTLDISSSAVVVDDFVTFTATVHNYGSAQATGVTLTDVLPPTLVFDSATTSAGTVGHVNQTVTANLGPISSGGSATVTIGAKAVAGGTADNTVNVTTASTENSTLNNSATVSVTVGQPNLKPTTPDGWSGPIVISDTMGTNTDMAKIASTSPVFVDIAYANVGDAPARAFFITEVYLDGTLFRSLDRQIQVAPGDSVTDTDVNLGFLSEGKHTLTFKLDTLGEVPESDEGDNVFSKPFTITKSETLPPGVGNYNGLVSAAGTRAFAKAGMLKGKVDKKGKVTGKIMLAGETFSFKGSMGMTGAVTFDGNPTLVLERDAGTPLTLALTVDLSGTDKLTGTLMDGATAFATIDADRAYYDGKARIPSPALQGDYTGIFARRTAAQNGLTVDKFPQGDGVVTFSISKKGAVKMGGTLADGSKVNYKGTLSKTNTLPFFIYTDNQQGSVSGVIGFEDLAASDATGPILAWFKPQGADVYPDGFGAVGIGTDFVASKFEEQDGVAALPGLAATNGMAQFTLSDGSLTPNPFLAKLSIDVDSQTEVLDPNTHFIKVDIKASSGEVSGSFTHSGGSDFKFAGVVLQKQSRASGYFLGPDQTGGVSIVPNAAPVAQ
ncbi:MAG: hypothetical protein QOE70_4467 [Chthoniobacter sp.]|jgi:uncharacterized repeat protein (TIGR01451 family)|nr:hypothetical protein [Chthoniobacter sp.]